jgi:cold shock CspA family protein
MQAASTRFNGTLKKWSAERGFGFVMAEQGGQDLFLHVSAMPKDGWIPVIGEPLSFEVEIDTEGRRASGSGAPAWGARGSEIQRCRASAASGSPARSERGFRGFIR